MRFENKTAVVTGGSRGIGLAIATKLAKEGANIAILYVGDENEGIKAKEELSQYGTRLSSISVMFQTLKSQRRLSIRSSRSSAVSKFL